MTAASEKELDTALEVAFQERPDFVRWFLSKTKFADLGAEYFWSRSDHPWGTIDYTTINPETGISETCRKECETDVLVVLKGKASEIVALHIENKMGSGKFTALQPELYRPRGEQWKNNPKYQNYTDFQTVLLAPRAFHDRNQTQSALFDVFIPHEDIACFIPCFGQSDSDA